MDEMKHDIEDNEIRVISKPDSPMADGLPEKHGAHKRVILAAIVGLMVIAAGVIFGMFVHKPKEQALELRTIPAEEEGMSEVPAQASTEELGETEAREARMSYTSLRDTTVNGLSLTILTPENARAELEIGNDATADSMAVLVVEAADIRADNGEIVGTYVERGALMSRGDSKAGFCAIIDGAMTVGVADATPYLEQAIENEGYFFRQYPLVVGGQVVENKPRGRALRKALAELNGRHVVVLSRGETSFHDFSQALADIGVTNAIYLVGSTAYGFARREDGGRIEFGVKSANPVEKVNYLVWR